MCKKILGIWAPPSGGEVGYCVLYWCSGPDESTC